MTTRTAAPRRLTAALALLALLAGVVVVQAAPSLAAHGINITVSDAEVLEGDGGGLPNQLVFTISATIPALSPTVVQVDYYTQDYKAEVSDSDYTAESGTAVMNAATPTWQVRVDVTGDTKLEPDEILFLGLTNAVNGHILDGSGEGKIINDDGPSVSIDDVDEDNGVPEGQGPLNFTVRLSEKVNFPVEVKFATNEGTATAPEDYEDTYEDTSGTVTIPAGDTSATGEIELTDDEVNEWTAEDQNVEQFEVTLTSADAVGSDAIVTISDATGIMTILDDDADAVIEVRDVAIAEGDDFDPLDPSAQATMVTVTVEIVEGETDQAITFDYATEDGTADGSDFPEMEGDYRNTDGSGEVPAGGAGTKTEIDVPIIGDTTPEAFETFIVRISNVSGNATTTKPVGMVTIQNDDATPAVNDVTVEEGDDAGFVVSIAYQSIEPVTVGYSTADGPAVDDANAGDESVPSDYTTKTGNVTIPAGETERTVAVSTIDDEIDERGDDASTGEQFLLNLSAGTGANGLADGQGAATLLDNDVPPMLSVGNPTFVEDNTGEREVQVTVMLVGNETERDVTFDWDLGADGDTATPDDDYEDASGSGEIEAGDRSTTVPVTIFGDIVPEPDETFSLVTSNVVHAAPAAAAGIVTIENDDETVAIEDASFTTEGDTGTTTTTVTVRIGEAQDAPLTFDWTTQDSTEPNAAASTDYTSDSGEVTIPAGQTTAQITVEAVGDTVDEADEVFEVTISSPSDPDVIIIDDIAVVTIPDDDGVSLRIDDAEVIEGDSGTTMMVFDVYLTGGGTAGGDVTFDWETSNGSATEGVIIVPGDGDYDGDSGSGSIPSDSTSTTIEVTVNGDTDPEDYETFTVTLSGVSGATEDDLEATGTILNDDTELSIADSGAGEGDGSVVFTVTASHVSELDASAEVDTANGTATAGQDYTAVVDGNVTVPAGQTSAQFGVTVIDDTIDESDTETFTATLSNLTNATPGDTSSATGTINDNDAPPSISAGDASVTEGDEDTTDVNVTLTLSSASDREVTVEFATSDGTATAGEDYAANTGSATFAPGVTEVTVTLAVAGDVEDEDDEHFFLSLSNPTNATIGDGTSKVTITDDDTTPSLSISDATVTEDDADGEVMLSVSLSQAAKKTVTVEYASQNGTATAGEDYDAVSGLLTFAVGETVKSIPVPINDDSDVEGDETFQVLLSSQSNATVADGTGVVTIQDDETPPAPENEDPTVDAGSSRAVETATSRSYSATGSDPDGDTLTYSWNFGDGSAAQTGNPVTHTYDEVGSFTVTVTVNDGNGGTASDTLLVNSFDTGVIGRSWGTDRILTAVAASQAHWPSAGHAQASAHTGPAATEALIAYAYKYPDALAAGPLSAKLDAPLLLSDTASLPAIVEEELERLGVSTVWLLGGPNSLSPAIEQRLDELGYQVKRRSGDSRFDTAADIATEVGRNSTGEVVVTLGEHADENRAFPDALSAGSLSASPQQMPLLLTRTDDLPLVTEQALAELDTRKVWIVGGISSVSANVEAKLRTLGYQVERLDGPGRYETSVAVAEEALSRAADGPVRLVFATGEKFPDGLAGGAIAGRVDGVLLLVPNGALPTATSQFLSANADRLDVGVILGGENTLSESVKAALVDLIDN